MATLEIAADDVSDEGSDVIIPAKQLNKHIIDSDSDNEEPTPLNPPIKDTNSVPKPNSIDSDSEIDDDVPKKKMIGCPSESSEGRMIDGVEVYVENQKTEKIKNKDLFDEEGDGDENSNVDNDYDPLRDNIHQETEKKKKPRKPRSKRLTVGDVKNVRSEIQKAKRNAYVSIPKHVPKQMTLREFLNRNKESSSVVPQATEVSNCVPPPPIIEELDKVSDWLNNKTEDNNEAMPNLEEFPSLEQFKDGTAICATEEKKKTEENLKKSPKKSSILNRINPKFLETKPKLDTGGFLEFDLTDDLPKQMADSDKWIMKKLQKHIVRKPKTDELSKFCAQKTSPETKSARFAKLRGTNKLGQLKAQLWSNMRKQRDEDLGKRIQFHKEENKNEEDDVEEDEAELSDDNSSIENNEKDVTEVDSEMDQNEVKETELHLELMDMPETLEPESSKFNEERSSCEKLCGDLDSGLDSEKPIETQDMVLLLPDSQFPLSQDISMSQSLLQQVNHEISSTNHEEICDIPGNLEEIRTSEKPSTISTQLLELCSGQFLSEDSPQASNSGVVCENATEIDNVDSGSDPDSDVEEVSQKIYRKKGIVESDEEDEEVQEPTEDFEVQNENFQEQNEDVQEQNEEFEEQNEDEDENVDSDDEEMQVMRQLLHAEKTGIPFGKFKDKSGKMRKDFLDAEAELSGDEMDSDENDDLGSEADELLPEEGDLDVLPDETVLRNQIGKVYLKQQLDDDKRKILAYQSALIDDKQTTSDAQSRRFRWRQAGEGEGDIQNLLEVGEEGDGKEGEDKEWDTYLVEKAERTVWMHQQSSQSQNLEDDLEDKDEVEDLSHISMLGRIALKKTNHVSRTISMADSLPANKADPFLQEDHINSSLVPPLIAPRRHSLMTIPDDGLNLAFPKMNSAQQINPNKALFTRISPKKPVKRPAATLEKANNKAAKIEENLNVSIFDVLNK